METKQFNSDTFYVDDITRELSERYDLKKYVGCLRTLGEANTEIAMGRFLFLAKLMGEVVGVDFEMYKKRFSGEQFFDYPHAVYDESVLVSYAQTVAGIITAPPLRKEEFHGKNIYFPMEELLKIMLTGTGYTPNLTAGNLQRK